MLLNLFNEMRAAKVPVSVRELLDLIDALKHRVVFADMDEFYYLARTIMVKDERHFDKFDRAFGAYFKGLEKLDDHLKALIPEEWLRKEFERLLTDEEKAQIQSLGGLDKLIEEFKKRLEEQKERHAGGNKWIGTGGTSPFGSGGFNPGSPELERIKRDYEVLFMDKCRAVLEPFAGGGRLTVAALRAMIGAAEALSHAAATEEIAPEEARRELYEAIVAMVARSRR